MMSVPLKNYCHKHSLPYEYICITSKCSCSIKLCQTCSTEHDQIYKNSQYMKNKHFSAKIQMEAEIALKQYAFLPKIQDKQPQQKNYANNKGEDLKVVEAIMKGMSEEKKISLDKIQDFLISHKQVHEKLKQTQASSCIDFFVKMKNQNLMQTALKVYSKKGLEHFRKKAINLTCSESRYRQFLSVTDKYGSSVQKFLELVVFDEPLLQEALNKMLFNEDTKKKENTSRNSKENQIRDVKSKEKQHIMKIIPSPKSQTANDTPRKKIFNRN